MKSILFIAALFVAAQYTQAQDWTGAINSDWNNPGNWNGFPTNGDDISISFSNYSGAMMHPVISTNSVFSPAQMAINGGAVLTINANLTTTDRVEILGIGTSVLLNSGILNISGGAGNARLVFSEQSQFTMSGGTLNVGQRLLFELGASGQMSNGTIDIVETFALIDGIGSVSSSFIQTGGVIDTEGFGFENEAGNFHPIFRMEGGVFNINGDFLVDGVSPGDGIGELYATEGEANFFGAIDNVAGSTLNYVLRFEENALFNVFGPSINQLAGDSIVITNGGTMNVQSNLNWTNNGVMTGEMGEVIIDAGVGLYGIGEYQFPYLTIPVNSVLNHVEPSLISVNGDFILAGSYNQLNHILEFNGSEEQSFTLNQAQTLDALVLNNSGAGVLVSENLTISDSMKWVNGILNMNSNQLIFPDEAVSLSASENSYAIGEVIKNGNDAFVFPVGSTGNRYRPIQMSAPASATTSISVTYFPESYSNVSSINAPLQSVSNIEYWNVTRSGSSSLVSLNAGWNNASESGLVDCASITLAHWFSNTWNFVPSVASGICNGTGSGSLQSNGDITDFGVFTIGFTEGVYQQAVQVCNGETFTVGANAYDSSGVYFDTFTDVNGEDSVIVTALTVLPEIDVTVQNNIIYLTANTAGANYLWLDCSSGNTPMPSEINQTFYPDINGLYAVIIEVNGCVDTSDCILVNQLGINETDTDLLTLYPNPVQTNGFLTLNSKSELISSEWFSINGAKLGLHSISTGEIQAPSLPGVYTLKLTLKNDQVRYRKIVVTN